MNEIKKKYFHNFFIKKHNNKHSIFNGIIIKIFYRLLLSSCTWGIVNSVIRKISSEEDSFLFFFLTMNLNCNRFFSTKRINKLNDILDMIRIQ
jgi:hypothetical protein